MTLKADPIVLHQALHGYDDGHRLLANSRPLPREAERVMLPLTDLPGSGLADGFGSYLTAYPLPAAGVYAFARSWYADEMPRPGCVWTHTLLIDLTDLSRLSSAAPLVALFRRPAAGLSGYDAAVVFDPEARGDRVEGPALDLAIRVVEALYGDPHPESVVVPVRRSGEAEAIFVAIWDRQWAGLKAAFSFSTGSLAPRLVDGVPVKLQAAPEGDVRRLWRKTTAAIVGTETNPPAARPSPPWARSVAEDCSDSAAPLERFVRTVGESLPADYSMFRPLVEAYRASRRFVSGELVDAVIAVVVDAFPAADDGVALKRALLDPSGDACRTAPLRMSEVDVVPALARSPRAAAFPPGPLSMRSRSAAWWPGHRDPGLLAEVAALSAVPIRGAFLEGVADAATVADVHRLAADRPGGEVIILARRATLALQPDFWNCSPECQDRLARSVTTISDFIASNTRGVLRAALAARADAAVAHLCDAGGDATLSVLMEWVAETGDPDSIGPRCCDWLRRRPGQLLAWLAATPPAPVTAWFASSLLDPTDPEVRRAGVGLWLGHVPAADGLPTPARQQFFGFLVILGLAEACDATFPAVAAAFPRVYRAASVGDLDHQTWSRLDPLLPNSSWWRDWDRCERLRRGVVDRFLEGRWSPHLVLQLGDDGEVYAAVIEEFRERWSGRSFLRGVGIE